jgi:osmotically-inducible protein OsmY
MGFFAKFFGKSYNDGQITATVQTAIDNDPLIKDPGAVVAASEKGVITLSGVVQKEQEKNRIEGVVRSALTTVGMKHERIINDLKISRQKL